MPIVNIQMFEGRTLETKRSICEKVAKVVAEEADVKLESVTVLIEELKRENYYNEKQ
ncbi:MAG: tautomerase family protein [bacterium]